MRIKRCRPFKDTPEERRRRQLQRDEEDTIVVATSSSHAKSLAADSANARARTAGGRKLSKNVNCQKESNDSNKLSCGTKRKSDIVTEVPSSSTKRRKVRKIQDAQSEDATEHERYVACKLNLQARSANNAVSKYNLVDRRADNDVRQRKLLAQITGTLNSVADRVDAERARAACASSPREMPDRNQPESLGGPVISESHRRTSSNVQQLPSPAQTETIACSSFANVASAGNDRPSSPDETNATTATALFDVNSQAWDMHDTIAEQSREAGAKSHRPGSTEALAIEISSDHSSDCSSIETSPAASPSHCSPRGQNLRDAPQPDVDLCLFGQDDTMGPSDVRRAEHENGQVDEPAHSLQAVPCSKSQLSANLMSTASRNAIRSARDERPVNFGGPQHRETPTSMAYSSTDSALSTAAVDSGPSSSTCRNDDHSSVPTAGPSRPPASSKPVDSIPIQSNLHRFSSWDSLPFQPDQNTMQQPGQSTGHYQWPPSQLVATQQQSVVPQPRFALQAPQPATRQPHGKQCVTLQSAATREIRPWQALGNSSEWAVNQSWTLYHNGRPVETIDHMRFYDSYPGPLSQPQIQAYPAQDYSRWLGDEQHAEQRCCPLPHYGSEPCSRSVPRAKSVSTRAWIRPHALSSVPPITTPLPSYGANWYPAAYNPVMAPAPSHSTVPANFNHAASMTRGPTQRPVEYDGPTVEWDGSWEPSTRNIEFMRMNSMTRTLPPISSELSTATGNGAFAGQ